MFLARRQDNKIKELLLRFSIVVLGIGASIVPYSIFIGQKSKSLMSPEKEIALYYEKYHLK